jgi:hypothetical protein
MQSLPQPTLPNVDINNLNTNNQQSYRQQANYAGSVHSHSAAPQQRPIYYQQGSNPNTVMGSQFGRRNSLSSVNSDQVGLTSHAQGQPWSSPYYSHSNNGSSSNLSYNIQHQQYQNPYHHNNNYPPPPQQQQHHQPPPPLQRQAYNHNQNYY